MIRSTETRLNLCCQTLECTLPLANLSRQANWRALISCWVSFESDEKTAQENFHSAGHSLVSDCSVFQFTPVADSLPCAGC